VIGLKGMDVDEYGFRLIIITRSVPSLVWKD
jgi:hypothetical protein